MSNLRINPDLFLESLELNRLVKFLDTDGFRQFLLDNTVSYGLVNSGSNITGSDFPNGLIQNGSGTRTIKHNDLRAIDKNGKAIVKLATDNISVPNDGSWYWVKVAYTSSSQEIGTVAIDTSGNLTGTGTKFTEVLRGQPNFPSKVRFIGASLNTLEYEVLEVINDTNAILQGTFSTESSLGLSVVGTFTPGVNPPSPSKDIFQYDSCTFTLVKETVLNTKPTFVTDIEFFLARVKASGSTCLIQDKRSLWKTKANYFLKNVVKAVNPLIGVEAVKFDHVFSTRDKNVMYIAWNFRSSNFTIDPTVNKVTINAGAGGKYKTTSDFSNGDFNGWRLYSQDGSYSYIKTSTKSGTQINLILDSIDIDKYSSDGGTTFISQELVITPDADVIEIKCTAHPGDSTELPTQTFKFNILESYGKCALLVYKSPSCTYNIKYHYRHLDDYSALLTIPSDAVGYYNEAQFDVSGNIIVSPVFTPYVASNTNGFITFTLAGSAFSNVVAGDLLGVAYVPFSNVSPVVTLTSGTSKQNEIFTGSLVLSGNYIISVLPGIKEGNTFYIYLSGVVNLNGFTFQIRQNYISPISTGTLLKQFTQDELNQTTASTYSSLSLKLIWDGSFWQITIVNDALESAWTTYNIVQAKLTPFGGAISSGSGIFRYKKIGKTMHFYVAIGITSTGTNVSFSVDLADVFVLNASSQNQVLINDGAGNFEAVKFQCNAGSSSVNISRLTSTFAAQVYSFIGNGTFEIQ